MPGAAADPLLAERITEQLHAAADPTRAPRMQAYMKSAMPYLGVPMPAVRSIVRTAARPDDPDADALLATAWMIWDRAQYREQWYAALELTGTRTALAGHNIGWLPFYDHVVTTGAWWDVVDACARRIGHLLRRHPEPTAELLRSWSQDPDLWHRRLAIIGQLDAREHTDVQLLRECILVNAGDPEFFIRKAIGWALRQYARTDPAWVRAFLAEHADVLSPLSIREGGRRPPR